MLIEDKIIGEITPQDVESLIGENERERLEFKETFAASDSEKQELLRDICAIANADGGLIIIGARASGEQCAGFVNMQNPDNLAQIIKQSVLDGIAERILDFNIAPLKLNSGETVLLIYIPSSFAKPHMVKRNNKTEFWKRYGTDKRTMSLAEVRQSFFETSDVLSFKRVEKTVNELGDKLDELHKAIIDKQTIESEIKSFNHPEEFHKITQTDVLLKKTDESFEKELGTRRALRLTITPKPLCNELFDPSNKKILEMLKNPPNQRYSGWNMENTEKFQITSSGFELRDWVFRNIILLRNGHFEFQTQINEDFSWKQSTEEFNKQPLLYPVPVTEYPVSFLRLAKVLYEVLNYKGNFIWRMLYYNIKGCELRPYHFRAIGFSMENKIFTQNSIKERAELQPDFNPDLSALNVIKELYHSVGFTREHIPFFDEKGHFSIPEG